MPSEPTPVGDPETAPTSLPSARRVGWSIAANYASLAASILFFIALLPYVNARLGSNTLGAWTIVLSAVGYLRLLDLGVGAATARFVAQSPSTQETNHIVATNAAVLVLDGAAAYRRRARHRRRPPRAASSAHEHGLALAMGIATVSTAIQVPLNIFGNVLFGLHRLVERNAFLVARVLGSAIAIVVTIELGGGLVAFVAAAAATELAVMLAQAVYCTVRIPGAAAAAARHRVEPRPRARALQRRHRCA